MATSKKNTKQKKPTKRAKKKAPTEPVVAVEGLYQEAIRITTAWLRAGYSEQKVSELIQKHYERFTPPNVQYVLHQASQLIANQYSRDRKNVIALHLRRYNQELEELKSFFIDQEYENIPSKFRVNVQLGKLGSWIEVLNAKERVLQLHAKETQVKIYNKLNTKVKEKKVSFDLSKLTLQEKIDFLSLIQKSKRTQNELMGIVSSAPVTQQQVEDIEHEVVETANVEAIKQTNLPKPQKAITPRETLDDLTDKLKQTLLKKAEEEFKKAGAKRIAPTVKDQHD